MNDRRPGPYARLLAQGRLAGLVAVAVVAGAVGGAWAVAGAPGLDRVTVMTVSDDGGGAHSSLTKEPGKSRELKVDKTGRPADAGKPSSKPSSKPSKAPKTAGSGSPGAQGLHGRCVSKVARSDATGGPNDNHGGAVSAAAKNCPRPSAAASADD